MLLLPNWTANEVENSATSTVNTNIFHLLSTAGNQDVKADIQYFGHFDYRNQQDESSSITIRLDNKHLSWFRHPSHTGNPKSNYADNPLLFTNCHKYPLYKFHT